MTHLTPESPCTRCNARTWEEVSMKCEATVEHPCKGLGARGPALSGQSPDLASPFDAPALESSMTTTALESLPTPAVCAESERTADAPKVQGGEDCDEATFDWTFIYHPTPGPDEGGDSDSWFIDASDIERWPYDGDNDETACPGCGARNMAEAAVLCRPNHLSIPDGDGCAGDEIARTWAEEETEDRDCAVAESPHPSPPECRGCSGEVAHVDINSDRLPGPLADARLCPWGADCGECGDVLLCWIYGTGDKAGIHDGEAAVCGGCGAVYSWSAQGEDDGAYIGNEGEPWGRLTPAALAYVAVLPAMSATPTPARDVVGEEPETVDTLRDALAAARRETGRMRIALGVAEGERDELRALHEMLDEDDPLEPSRGVMRAIEGRRAVGNHPVALAVQAAFSRLRTELSSAIESAAVGESVIAALRGEPVSDFMESFAPVIEAQTATHTISLLYADVAAQSRCITEACALLRVTDDDEADWPKLPGCVAALVRERDQLRAEVATLKEVK